MTASKALACRAARGTERTANYHLKEDPDFAAQANEARDHAIAAENLMGRPRRILIAPLTVEADWLDH